ncbi:unnamed protein product [Symbiodinium natans]|uniref:Uncharacterized protein n=1 Tax=Symbiodinium natans TaxID=878477 RepID=A0A812PR57_9DINO|nr:unnamed protein product [Symbiodinium natans]
MLLVGLQVLPSYDMDWLQQPGVQHNGPFLPCCAVSGLVSFILVLLLWRPQTQVFVDRICIHQQDPALKAEGIFNMGGILKHSSSILVMFDRSWAERLWCVYELAAFIKSHEDDPQAQVLVRPTALAPGSCIALLTVATFSMVVAALPAENKLIVWGLIVLTVIVVTFWASLAMRGFFRDLKQVESALKHFRMDKCSCWCCENGHVHPKSGEPIQLCDRELLQRCICVWFGSVETFEDSVSNTASAALVDQLGSNAFTYSWMLMLCCPFCWSNMDRIVANILVEDYKTVLELSLLTLVGWLCCAPVFIRCALVASRRWSDRQPSFCREFLATCACAFSPLPAACVYGVFQVSLNQGIPYYGVVIYFFLAHAVTYMVWNRCLNRKVGNGPAELGRGHVAASAAMEFEVPPEAPLPPEPPHETNVSL